MSTTNLNSLYNYITTDGLSSFEVDQIVDSNGQIINTSNLVTYTGANQDVDLGNYGLYAHNLVINGLDVEQQLSTKASLSYVNTQDANLQSQINTKADKTYVDTQLLLKADKTFVDSQLLLKADKTYVDTNLALKANTADVTASLALKADKTYVDTNLALKANSSDVTAALALKANLSALSNYLPLTGGTMSGKIKNSLYSGNKALISNSDKEIIESSVTLTELNYVSNVTSSIQSQLNQLGANMLGYLPLSGGTLSGDLTLSGTGTSAGVLAKRFYLKARTDNQDDVAGDEKFGPWYGLGDSGISGFTGKPCLAGYYGCALRSGSGYLVLDENGKVGIGKTDPQNLLDVAGASRNTISGAYADSTAYHIYTTTANHYDGNASTTYLMSGLSGYLTLANKTTRTDGDACIMWGTNSSVSEVNSVTTDGSDLKPLNFGGSSFLFSGGDVTINNSATISGDLHNNRWVTGGDYRDGIAPNIQVGGTMGYYFGRYGNGSGDYSDSLVLNGWGDGSAGNVNLIAFNKGGKGIRQFQGTHGSGSNMTTYYDCVMTDSNSSNVNFSGNVGIGTSSYACTGLNFPNNGAGINWGNGYSRILDDAQMRICTDDMMYFYIGSNSGSYGNQKMLLTNSNLEIDVTTSVPNGDNSYTYYGPNSSWGSYLYVGATPNRIDRTEVAQVITTNGNLHLDSGDNREIYINYYKNQRGAGGSIYSYGPWGHNGSFTASQVYTNDWFRINSNQSGIYWQNLGRGIYAAGADGGGYGTITTYGSGLGGCSGYGLGSKYILMKYDSSDGGGLYDYLQGKWVLYWDGQGTGKCYVGGGAVQCSLDWDRLVVFRNGYNYDGGYFYVNQGGGYGMASDMRIKKNIESIPENKSIEFIQNLQPSSFCMKDQRPVKKKNPDGTEEEFTPSMCTCKEDGWIAQNVLEAAEAAGIPKSLVNNWYDYKEQLNKPEEERKAILGVSDRPILSHTVNVVKHLLIENESLKKTIQEQNQKIDELQKIVVQHNTVLTQIIEQMKLLSSS